VPVTAKLSRKFYERLGDDVANELVEWFNAVDATYRGELRELNEVNFARFEAKLEQRIAELRAELVSRMDGLEARLNGRMDQLERRFDLLDVSIRAEMERRFGDQEKRLGEHARWMFLGWLSLMIPLVAMLFQVARGG
jgi:hypothetical protein